MTGVDTPADISADISADIACIPSDRRCCCSDTLENLDARSAWMRWVQSRLSRLLGGSRSESCQHVSTVRVGRVWE